MSSAKAYEFWEQQVPLCVILLMGVNDFVKLYQETYGLSHCKDYGSTTWHCVSSCEQFCLTLL